MHRQHQCEEFRIPWTGGNPKRGHAGSLVMQKFRIPWTGGNPKRKYRSHCLGDEFRIPWTGGNPKRRNPCSPHFIKFRIPWTGGNPKRAAGWLRGGRTGENLPINLNRAAQPTRRIFDFTLAQIRRQFASRITVASCLLFPATLTSRPDNGVWMIKRKRASEFVRRPS